MSSTSTHKKQFYSKLKFIKKSNNRLISREHLELVKKYLSNQHQENFSYDDNVNDTVAKTIKKRIKGNKFTLVNMGVETNVVCALKKEICSFKVSVSGCFLVLATDMQLGEDSCVVIVRN